MNIHEQLTHLLFLTVLTFLLSNCTSETLDTSLNDLSSSDNEPSSVIFKSSQDNESVEEHSNNSTKYSSYKTKRDMHNESSSEIYSFDYTSSTITLNSSILQSSEKHSPISSSTIDDSITSSSSLQEGKSIPYALFPFPESQNRRAFTLGYTFLKSTRYYHKSGHITSVGDTLLDSHGNPSEINGYTVSNDNSLIKVLSFYSEYSMGNVLITDSIYTYSTANSDYNYATYLSYKYDDQNRIIYHKSTRHDLYTDIQEVTTAVNYSYNKDSIIETHHISDKGYCSYIDWNEIQYTLTKYRGICGDPLPEVLSSTYSKDGTLLSTQIWENEISIYTYKDSLLIKLEILNINTPRHNTYTYSENGILLFMQTFENNVLKYTSAYEYFKEKPTDYVPFNVSTIPGI